MAWTEQAWRYAFHGLPDPAQDLTEQQVHLSFSRIPNASDLAVIQPLLLSREDAFSFHGIPDPADDLGVTARLAIHDVFSIGLSDSLDRDGLIDANLSGLGVSFSGTVEIPEYEGRIDANLDGISASFLGSFTYRHYFDVEYSVTPIWVATERPARFGDIDAQLGGLTVALQGFTLPPQSTFGNIDANLSGLSVDFQGTVGDPPSYEGRIASNLSGLRMLFEGFTVPPGGVAGFISANLDGLNVDFSGTFERWDTDGQIDANIGGLNVSIIGSSFVPGTIVGRLDSNLGGLSVSFVGGVTQLDNFALRFESDSRSMRFDSVSPEIVFNRATQGLNVPQPGEPQPIDADFLLLEDGDFMLNEARGKLIREES